MALCKSLVTVLPPLVALLSWLAACTAPAAGQGSDAPKGPPAAREIRVKGCFRSARDPEWMRVWIGPNDAPGWERLTKLQAEIGDAQVYSMAARAIRFAGVCRAAGSGLDQVILSFNREPRGKAGAGALFYDERQGKFTLEFVRRDITLAPDQAFDCSGGRTLLPENESSPPCRCPWGISPLRPGGPSASAN